MSVENEDAVLSWRDAVNLANPDRKTLPPKDAIGAAWSEAVRAANPVRSESEPDAVAASWSDAVRSANLNLEH